MILGEHCISKASPETVGKADIAHSYSNMGDISSMNERVIKGISWGRNWEHGSK